MYRPSQGAGWTGSGVKLAVILVGKMRESTGIEKDAYGKAIVVLCCEEQRE